MESNVATPPRPVHSLTLREHAAITVDVLADGRVRLALQRRSPASEDPADFHVASAIAFDVGQCREIIAALRFAVHQIEATAPEVDA